VSHQCATADSARRFLIMAETEGPYRKPINTQGVIELQSHTHRSQGIAVPDGIKIVTLAKPSTEFQIWEGLEYCNLYDATDGVIGWCRHHKDFDHHTHYHDASEVIYVTDGEAKTFHDGEWVTVTKGDCIVADSRQQHRTCTSSSHMDCLYFFPDGPQGPREYWYMDDVPGEKVENKEQNDRPYPLPNADPRGGITPAPPASSGWHQLVDDKTWSVARLQLTPGTSHTNQSHRFCFVLDGDVKVRPSNADSGVTVAPNCLAFSDAEGDAYSLEPAGDQACTVLMFCAKRAAINNKLAAKL